MNADISKVFNGNTSMLSDENNGNRFSQGMCGERQQEIWKLHLSEKKKKTTYLEGKTLRKKFIDTGEESASSIDEPKEELVLHDERVTEIWNSPPASEVKSVKRPALAKEKSVAKKSAKKTLKELFDSKESGHEHLEDPDIICQNVQQPVEALGVTYYGQYAVPPIFSFRNVRLVNKLSPSETKYIWNTCRGDVTRPILIYGDRDRFISLDDLGQLLDEKQMSTATVDACINCLQNLYNNDGVCILSSTEGKEIYQCEFSQSLSVNEVNLRLFNIVLVPYLLPGHWVLTVIG